VPELPCHAIARQILADCLEGRAWSADDLERLLDCAASSEPVLAHEGAAALFQVLAEGLADRFDRRLSKEYARMFSRAIERAEPSYSATELESRYLRICRPEPFHGDPSAIQRVYVLSRVTLGADVAVTSVILDGAKRRFPHAQITLAGEEKNWRLFAADSRLAWLPVRYQRGTLAERLASARELAAAIGDAALVIDPDSRLTQLGLLPVAPEKRYFFFDSRSSGGDRLDSLTVLTQRWVEEIFGVQGAQPYVAPADPPEPLDGPCIVVNFGVGGNPAKRVPDPFEEELLRALARKEGRLLVDLGAGGEEESRVRRAIARSGAPARQATVWRGSFAALAATIARASLYVGYDSAGQHAAAACGTPLVSVFAGFCSPRMMARWTPTGPGPKRVIPVGREDPTRVLDQVIAAADALIPNPAA